MTSMMSAMSAMSMMSERWPGIALALAFADCHNQEK
jgi:hypothetical protein